MGALRENSHNYREDPVGESIRDQQYQRTSMKRNVIMDRLRKEGCRITKQRKIILDIILQEECTCCKEIYYKAMEIDPGLGAATVYRMVNLLEEIGAISRKNMYKISCGMDCGKENACTIELEDNTVIELNEEKWNQIIRTGLAACGITADGQKVRSITANMPACVEA